MRAEPFLLALATLREKLSTGAYPPGARLAAGVIAEDLRLSPTPVREALSRLAGEGLLEERRGQGFFVRTLRGDDLADLYRLHLALLQIALDPHRAGAGAPATGEAADVGAPPTDAVARTDGLFSAWVRARGSPALREAHERLSLQIRPTRILEPVLIPDLDAEAEALEQTASADRSQALRRFHQRRIRLADRLAVLAERRPARTIERI